METSVRRYTLGWWLFGLVAAVALFVFLPACDGLLTTEHDGVIERSETWHGYHRVVGDLTIRSAAVTVACGTRIEINPGARIHVTDGGRLRSAGRPDCPVVWSVAGDAADQGWSGIRVGRASRLIARHTTFEHVRPITAAVDAESKAVVEMSDASFRHIAGTAVELARSAELTEANRLEFVSIKGRPLRLFANHLGSVDRLHVENASQSIAVEGGDLTEPATWDFPRLPIMVTRDVFVRSELRVTAESELRLRRGASVVVEWGGRLRAIGDRSIGYRSLHQWVRLSLGSGSRLVFKPTSARSNILRWTLVSGPGTKAERPIDIADGVDVELWQTRIQTRPLETRRPGGAFSG